MLLWGIVRVPRTTLLAVCSLFALGAIAADVLLPDAYACSQEESSVEQHKCLGRKAREREARISSAEHRVRDAINRWDEEQKYRDRSLDLLETSRKAYLAQRSEVCEVEASTAADGNAARDLRLMCQERWDIKWIEQLAILEKMYGHGA